MNNKNLNSAQQQQLVEIGLKLNQVRTAKNISLDTVSANTRITKRLLKAIESGNSEELPEPFYIRALVAKFAQEIGATGIEFIFQSSKDTEATEKTTKSHTERRYWLNFQLRSLHLYLLYILLIVVSVKIITSLVESPVIINQVPEENPTANSEVQESEATAQIKQPESAPQFVSQSNNSESVIVGINLQERCWLKVMVDGKLAFEGTLPKGTQRQWTGEKQVTIRAGNAGGVVISFNNEQQKILGAPGEVEEITYTVN
ncbi:helix-turn-helix domain-containing protein [Pleurocapsa sp. PCC 7319]|uniref:helix-turn-helix domain-containing protein n=1 Tax=Pleurocapsa sp. PCC 7319 TaxID=118161 RepID=UPI00034C8B64|nr:helix-turn-helix domain-containing protein [Pleurocapsa sp. PCC 7319]